jgi:cell wall-associated NlpC family hydrolase
MSAAKLDPRLYAFRPDVADARLRGKTDAARFVEGVERRVATPSAPLKCDSGANALDTELLLGEVFRVFDEADGYAWGQSPTDNYVGYVPADSLGPMTPEPTHRVTVLRTFIYPNADMKLPAVAALSLGSRVALGEEVEARGTRYARIVGNATAIVAAHAEPIDAPPEPDFVAVAEGFLNVPYLWGGRTSLGLDCSALVQLSLMAAGKVAPRDTDMQRDLLGAPIDGGLEAELRRGDLVFWPGAG